MKRNKIGKGYVSRCEELEVQQTQNRNTGRRIALWLEAELNGDDQRAERELGRSFRALSVPTPSADLAETVLERLGLGRRSRRAGVLDVAFRLFVTSGLAAAGLALVVVPRIVWPWLASVRLSWLVDWWTATLVGVSQRFAGGLAVWRVLGDIADTAAGALSSPAAVAVLTAAVLVSLISLRALSGLVSFERSAGNA
jgi:hypothetical protein